MKYLLPFVAGILFSTVVHAQVTVIRCGRLIDGKSDRAIENAIIIIHGDTITNVGPGIRFPHEAEFIDLNNETVMPGLIDCHTHITGQTENYYDDTFRRSPIDDAVRAHIYALRTLEAGFTTCRDVGSSEFVDVALKKAINEGLVAGPRLFVAGHALSATGGHGDLNGFSPYLHFDTFNGVVDGVDEIRKKVRWNIKVSRSTSMCAVTRVVVDSRRNPRLISVIR